ncbi:unnamed protein product [Anisakis simplex]|uniref:Pentatricopeptide repeat-containing protein n=1 Tax=Anisakis simplex TaxID=6269 RepID=A0A0M3J887_ANISI|nr:unnamed protein product [Anisakis simplex]
MAAASYSTEKSVRTLRRKASFIVGVPKLPSYQNQPQFISAAQQLTNEEKLQRALSRTHFDVVRTASFGGNPSRHLFKEPDSNRNSLPLSVLSLDFE